MNSTTTARLTGAAYLALAVAGAIGFLGIRPALYAPGDAAATLNNLSTQSALAHTGVALEVIVVIVQALAALGFYALMHRDRPTAAFGVAVFGMANAVAILSSAVFIGAALSLAEGAGEGSADTVNLLYLLSEGCWSIGGVFFGLWLIPMGWYALSTLRMPRVLGWALIIGGVGYVLGTLLTVAAPGLGAIADALSSLATIGELWMVGYLLVRGIRQPRVISSTAVAV
jgi:hypothetical protein